VAYHQGIRIRSTVDDNTNTDYVFSRWGHENDPMKHERTGETSMAFSSSDEPITLELSFIYSKEKVASNSVLKKTGSASSGIRVVNVRLTSFIVTLYSLDLGPHTLSLAQECIP
jgi:hypothetical protein